MSNNQNSNQSLFQRHWFSANPDQIDQADNSKPSDLLSKHWFSATSDQLRLANPVESSQNGEEFAEVRYRDPSVSRRARIVRVQNDNVPPPPLYENTPIEVLETPEPPSGVPTPRALSAVESSAPRRPPQRPQPETSFLEVSINFFLDHWKIILSLGGSLILFLVAFFLVLFFVIIPPTAKTTVVSNTTTTAPNTTTVTVTTRLPATLPTTVITTRPTTVVTTTRITTTEQTFTMKPTTLAAGTTCTNNFVLVNTKCLKLITGLSNRVLADNQCRNLAGGAALVSIKSSDENEMLYGFLRYQTEKRIWIGLQCDRNKCAWDYGRGNIALYNNFAEGSPSVDVGKCVYYLVSDQKWVSGDCEQDFMGYVCELPPTVPDDCTYNYNNNCYAKIGNVISVGEAEQICSNACSHVVSIHSELENQFLKSIVNETVLLGGVAPANNLILWEDESHGGFLNFHETGYDPNHVCIFMKHTTGHWKTESDLLIDFENVPEISEKSVPTIVAVSSDSEPKTEFEPVERQRHFGILQYVIRTRLQRVMLIGLVNIILIAALFVFIVTLVTGQHNSPDTDVTTLETTATTITTKTKTSCAYEFQGNCYLKIGYSTSVPEAEQICISACAHVISILSEQENQFLMSIVQETTLLGGAAPSKHWIFWEDRSFGNFSNFQETGYNPNHVCILMDSQSGNWRTDSVCTGLTWCKRGVEEICNRF
ncbi:hypothetical protein CAEBREN_00683 [Caenorhabditis brenneri]|uniref:C-type lectin domain-containing protein n=1 Tax=Caenorhabditis brenneri TaxID=135651 RepID=G0N324_CAEBE|nr:hypothetical protein CAEBREN_00683 [Caenorhabditis brenneri]